MVSEPELERLRERIGVPRTKGSSMFPGRTKGMAISSELARRCAMGLSDTNPLYLDDDYAKNSIWGRRLCPPSLLAWIEQVNGATDGFPGCHTIWRECELQWERPLFVGDTIESESYLKDARIVESEFSGKSAIQDYETAARTEDGEALGFYRTSWHRFSRDGSKHQSKHASLERHMWTDAELEAVWDEYRSQNLKNRRGTEPLYWEDVTVGTDIPYIVKGPTTLTSKFAFESIGGPGGWFVGHELALELYEKHPGLSIRNEENVPEPPVGIHWTNERTTRFLGMPGAYEAGYERLGWLIQLLTSWCGDHGMVHNLKLRFKGFHFQGDVIRLYGKVTGKREDGTRHFVDLDIETVTQRGEPTSVGRATVLLPSRKAGTEIWPA